MNESTLKIFPTKYMENTKLFLLSLYIVFRGFLIFRRFLE